MNKIVSLTALVGLLVSTAASSLSLAPEEFAASRQMACVLAEHTLGTLNEEQYGEVTNSLLGDFDPSEQENIVSKAIGYYDGLMFSIPAQDADAVSIRLQDFVDSNTCQGDAYRKVTHTL